MKHTCGNVHSARCSSLVLIEKKARCYITYCEWNKTATDKLNITSFSEIGQNSSTTVVHSVQLTLVPSAIHSPSGPNIATTHRPTVHQLLGAPSEPRHHHPLCARHHCDSPRHPKRPDHPPMTPPPMTDWINAVLGGAAIGVSAGLFHLFHGRIAGNSGQLKALILAPWKQLSAADVHAVHTRTPAFSS